MSTVIVEDDVKKIFDERIKGLMEQNRQPAIGELVQSVIGFYEDYKIENVDTSFSDEDTLLFEYGIYDWQDGKGENFTISIIRQYIPNPEVEMQIRRIQLHLVLYYNSKDFENIEPFSTESVDFGDMTEFKDCIINSEGFIQAANKTFTSYDIFLIHPE